MIAQHAVDDYRVTWTDLVCAQIETGGNNADTRGRDEQAVAFPRSTTFVSPVTIRTPARAASAAMEPTIRRRRAISQPSSMMNAAESQRGRAPPTTRSFTVPQTANVPMSPPGNSSG